MNDAIPLPSNSTLNPKSERIYYISAFVFLALILAVTLWNAKVNKPLTESERIGREKEKEPAIILAQMLNRNYVTGLVKEVSSDGIRIGITAPMPDLELFAALSPETALYKEDSKNSAKKIKIALSDISIGSFVKIVADGDIGSRSRVDAIEIIKLQ